MAWAISLHIERKETEFLVIGMLFFRNHPLGMFSHNPPAILRSALGLNIPGHTHIKNSLRYKLSIKWLYLQG